MTDTQILVGMGSVIAIVAIVFIIYKLVHGAGKTIEHIESIHGDHNQDEDSGSLRAPWGNPDTKYQIKSKKKLAQEAAKNKAPRAKRKYFFTPYISEKKFDWSNYKLNRTRKGKTIYLCNSEGRVQCRAFIYEKNSEGKAVQVWANKQII